MWQFVVEWVQNLRPTFSSGYPAVGLQVFPYLLGFMLVEVMLYTKVTKREFPKLEFISSVVLGIGYGFSSIIPLIVYAGAYVWLWEHRFFTVNLNTSIQWAILFVAGDFMYYWFHRFAHRCKWYWSVHAVHHSPSQMYFAVAFQLPWIGAIAPQIVFWTPLVLLGFHPGAVLFSLKLNLIFQFFLHTEIIRKLPKPLEFILNTTSHHRVHHASKAQSDAQSGLSS
jgi:sterol desaturase/sphingolipid hydroxylase (fatty acid hydroxylase superfamily)